MHQTEKASVHFTEAFLTDASTRFNDENLKSIAFSLACDPYCGDPFEGIANLRRYDFQLPGQSLIWHIWYLVYPEIARIEVVGFSNAKSAYAEESARKTAWKVLKIGTLLRSAYAAFKALDSDLDVLP